MRSNALKDISLTPLSNRHKSEKILLAQALVLTDYKMPYACYRWSYGDYTATDSYIQKSLEADDELKNLYSEFSSGEHEMILTEVFIEEIEKLSTAKKKVSAKKQTKKTATEAFTQEEHLELLMMEARNPDSKPADRLKAADRYAELMGWGKVEEGEEPELIRRIRLSIELIQNNGGSISREEIDQVYFGGIKELKKKLLASATADNILSWISEVSLEFAYIVAATFGDQMWRMHRLYSVKTKENGIKPFIPNHSQKRFYYKISRKGIKRITIPKGRQSGFSTGLLLFLLDCCMWINGFRAALIADTQKNADKLFNEKVKLPAEIFIGMLGQKPFIQIDGEITRGLIKFTNGSRLEAGVTAIGDTLHGLHISEYGKTSQVEPKKAIEIRNSSIPAVTMNGFVFIESTHRGGRTGENYNFIKQGIQNQSIEDSLSPMEFALLFVPWFEIPEYRISLPPGRSLRSKTIVYFEELSKYYEATGDTQSFDEQQMFWYENQRETFRNSVQEEYPSTIDEVLSVSSDEKVYSAAMIRAYEEKRVVNFEINKSRPCYCVWDMGYVDLNIIILLQYYNGKIHIIEVDATKLKEPEDHAETIMKWKRGGYKIHKHIYPHDATAKKIGKLSMSSMLESIGYNDEGEYLSITNYERVPKVGEIGDGIAMLNRVFDMIVFHKDACEKEFFGLRTIDKDEPISLVQAMQDYRLVKRIVPSGGIKIEDVHDENSHFADAMRYIGEGIEARLIMPDLSGDQYDKIQARRNQRRYSGDIQRASYIGAGKQNGKYPQSKRVSI